MKRTQHDEIQELKGMVFDIKDNHLKSIYQKLTDHDIFFERLNERTKLILTLVSIMLGTVVIGGSVAVIIKMCF